VWLKTKTAIINFLGLLITKNREKLCKLIKKLKEAIHKKFRMKNELPGRLLIFCESRLDDYIHIVEQDMSIRNYQSYIRNTWSITEDD